MGTRWATLWLLLASTGIALAVEPTQRDVEYAVVDGHSLKLDVYADEAADKSCPLVVWVHGGAWRRGSKDSVPVTHWLNHGFVIASVDYRLSPIAKFPAQIHDIKAAIRFLRAHADDYGINRERVVVAGSSAGGHLAALVGVTNGVEILEGDVGQDGNESSEVQAIVSFCGASNLETILSQSTPHGLSVRVPALKLLLGDRPEKVPSLAKSASPVAHVDVSAPPLWLIHGDADPQMPAEQSAELAAAYRAAKAQVDFEVIPQAVHGGAEFYEPERLDQLAEQIQLTLESD